VGISVKQKKGAKPPFPNRAFIFLKGGFKTKLIPII
jgi:hypothetical protein